MAARYIHPSAEVSPDALVGDRTTIWHLAQVRPGAVIGEECIIGRGVYVADDVVIGKRVRVQSYVCLYTGMTIEDGVFIGPHAVFTNDLYPRSIKPDGSFLTGEDWELIPTRICYGASIGANATIICGVTIGRWAMVGAGAVITRSVPNFALMLGVPARQVGWVGKNGVPLPPGENPPED